MYRPVQYIKTVTPYQNPEGRTFGRVTKSSGNFPSYLNRALSSQPAAQSLSTSSPLVRLASLPPAGGNFYLPGLSGSRNASGSGGSSAVTGVSGTYSTTSGSSKYQAVMVAETARAPMAMFGYGDELVVSVISRSDMDCTPVYTYSGEEGLRLRSVLGEQAESGNYGFSAGGTLHMVAEAWDGMVDWTATSPDGPWIKNDFSDICPHSYKNLKWGFGYKCPVTGQQYLGFGNDDHPGCVLQYKNDSWQVLAAPEDMLFPTSMGVISKGSNQGTALIASATYGQSRLHTVSADGTTEKAAEFAGWGYMTVDHTAGIAYFASETGHVYYSSFNDLKNWKECQYQDAQGKTLSKLGRCGELNVHPKTGKVIVPVAEQGGAVGDNQPVTEAATLFYEAVVQNGKVTLKEAGRVEGTGFWELRTAVVGDELYYGSGLVSDKAQDAGPGAIYRVDVA